ncbi:flagellar protein FlgN [Cytobacillus purgationiresistens]|uniref:Flagellar biosynthesis/type III secretory pathway chaperone n=1 Tax=Cytobacillus purgationiresistens TaxID=863449 RepID=A0ABU0ACX4_9BACI|nr:flagellar protein FlgN [Cytobacillus purgationiresistens]MDQ0269094.1 flagellar biosynthesis/type III secretory pathway chaperone [Cytobacillus purgationiresistens]
MSTEALITSMNNLLMLHKSLNELAIKKTDIIKTGDMEALDQMMKDEQKHVAAIGKWEEKRNSIVQAIVPDQPSPTLSDCLPAVSNEQQLRAMKDELIEIVEELKERNQMNQQLVYQSLQFVNMSLSLAKPQQASQNMNYVHPQAAKQKQSSGMFNSKV